MGKILINLLTIIGLFSVSSAVLGAMSVDVCGDYYAEGFYAKMKSIHHNDQIRKVIILEKGSNSQIVFYPQNKNLEKILPTSYLDSTVKLQLKFTSKCWYFCSGEIVEVIGAVPLYENPRPFLFPRPRPLKNSEVGCRENVFESSSIGK